MTFTHLHGHSTFSFLEAIGKPKQIVAKAKELGMSSIAITDFNGMFSAIDFYSQAKDAGIKPIIGLEVGFSLDLSLNIDPKRIGNICFLVSNKEGYYNLMKITSYANTIGNNPKPRVDINYLKQNSEGIIVHMGGPDSRLGKMIQFDEKKEKMEEILGMLCDIFGKDNVYLEVVAQDYKENDLIKRINTRIIELAKNLSLKCVVNNNYYYIKKDDKIVWEMALAIKDGAKMYDDWRRKPKGMFHIMNEDEIISVMRSNGYESDLIQSRIESNNQIAEKIETDIKLGQTLFPNYESPQDIIEIYDKCKNDLICD